MASVNCDSDTRAIRCSGVLPDLSVKCASCGTTERAPNICERAVAPTSAPSVSKEPCSRYSFCRCTNLATSLCSSRPPSCPRTSANLGRYDKRQFNNSPLLYVCCMCVVGVLCVCCVCVVSVLYVCCMCVNLGRYDKRQFYNSPLLWRATQE
jgi:hypothetical protein